MNNAIILLTECGAEKGYGHLTRCVSLAHTFRDVGWQAEIWVACDGSATARLPQDARHVDWYDVSEQTAPSLERAYAVMVDSLVVTAEQLEQLAHINPRIAILDDWLRRPHRRGIVIDWTIGAEKFAYPERSFDVQYLLGSQYCAMRPEFTVASKRSFVDPPRATLITFGGSDIRQLSVPVLAMLRERFPSLHRHVVVGAGVRDKSFVSDTRDDNTTFHVACDAAQMRTVMEQSDFAISAGGQTLYELASQGLPPVVIGVVDNQGDDIREFGAVGFAWIAGDWLMPDLLSNLAAGVTALWPAPERQQRSTIGRSCVDGGGAARLTAACLEIWEAQSIHV